MEQHQQLEQRHASHELISIYISICVCDSKYLNCFRPYKAQTEFKWKCMPFIITIDKRFSWLIQNTHELTRTYASTYNTDLYSFHRCQCMQFKLIKTFLIRYRRQIEPISIFVKAGDGNFRLPRIFWHRSHSFLSSISVLVPEPIRRPPAPFIISCSLIPHSIDALGLLADGERTHVPNSIFIQCFDFDFTPK